MARPGRDPSVRAKVLDPRDLSEAQLSEWRSFQDSSPALASPYLTPEFVRAASEVRRDISVAVYEEGRRTAGFFPFQRRGRVAKPVGGPLSDCQAVIAAPGWQWDPKGLVRAAGLSVYEFTCHRAEQSPLAPFFRAMDISPTIDLQRGFDAYVQECRERGRQTPGASSGLPHHTMARMRRLERQLGPIRFAMHDPGPEPLRRLIAWKSEQYRRSGYADVFAHRWTVELLERIQATRTATFAGVLSTLHVGDRIVAAHMGMRSATVLHWWFPAYDMAEAKFSPGMILLLELSRAAAECGIRTIELGPGDEPYKRLVANDGVPVAAGFVGPASLAVLYRQFRYASSAWAARLPIGPAARWPERVFRRLDKLHEFS